MNDNELEQKLVADKEKLEQELQDLKRTLDSKNSTVQQLEQNNKKLANDKQELEKQLAQLRVDVEAKAELQHSVERLSSENQALLNQMEEKEKQAEVGKKHLARGILKLLLVLLLQPLRLFLHFRLVIGCQLLHFLFTD